MATTLNKPPHGADGNLDPQAAQASMAYMAAQVTSGQELMLGAYRVDQADGSHLTIIHHIAASAARPGGTHQKIAMKVPGGSQQGRGQKGGGDR